MTEDAHTSVLITMHWPSQGNNHAQCSTERYTNDQKMRFIQQHHNSNEVLGTSQTSGTYLANASSGATSSTAAAAHAGGIFSKK